MTEPQDPMRFPAEFTLSDTSNEPDTTRGDRSRPSAAKKLIEIARTGFRFSRSTEGGALFAIPLGGPHIAHDMGDSAFGNLLASRFYAATGDAASGEAISSAMRVMEADAAAADAEPVHIRVADFEGGLVLDLGDESGRAVQVDSKGWRVLNRSPVPFRRTAITGAMPVPERGGSIGDLAAFLNVDDKSREVLVGWMLAAWRPSVPCPILLLSGGQGTGKSSATRILSRIVDPSSCEDRQPPRDNEQLLMAAQCSRLVLLDNVSAVSQDLSDSLCRLCTGGGFIKRKLYTNAGITAATFRRAAILNSIDVAAIRGDFAERVVVCDLAQIPSGERRFEEDLNREFNNAHPQIFGSLLDIMAKTLTQIDTVRLDRVPRMADFARLVGAMDSATGSNALATYAGQEARVAEDVLESSPIAPFLIDCVRNAGFVRGLAGEILEAISPPGNRPKALNITARKLSGELRRLKPALETAGYVVTLPTGNGPSQRVFEIAQPGHPGIDHEYAVVTVGDRSELDDAE